MRTKIIDTTGNGDRFYYINKKHQTRYEISMTCPKMVLRIEDTTTGKIDYRVTTEFVHGTTLFDPETDRYPGYVHDAVWILENHVRQNLLFHAPMGEHHKYEKEYYFIKQPKGE